MDHLFEKFQQKHPRAKHIKIRLIKPCVDMDSLIKRLTQTLCPLREQDPVLLHIDTAGVRRQAFVLRACWPCCLLLVRTHLTSLFQVRTGLEELLFRLLVLGCVSDSHGTLWRRNEAHLITVEVLKPNVSPQNQPREVVLSIFVYFWNRR